MSEWSIRRGIDEISANLATSLVSQIGGAQRPGAVGTALGGPLRGPGPLSLSIPLGGGGPDEARDPAFAGKYRVIRKLGTGSMGAVYLAEHLEIGRLTAIKVLRESIARNSAAREQFLQGARNAGRIHHSHVCAVYDVGETGDGLAYMAMEYVEGGSLGDVLARLPRFGIERACRIGLQVLEALAAAHALGIVHRDLKPGNIILAVGDDGDDHVKVLDFDIASRMMMDGDAPDARFMIGSPEFMSPEQIAGEPVDGRSDLYSLGIILYRAVTGNFPFSAKGAQELMLKRLTEKPIPLREVSPSGRFPPGLQDLLDAALSRRPEKRFNTAQEMGWALSQVADPRVLAGQRSARRQIDEEFEEAERARLERSPFRRPVVRVLAFWAVGLIAGMFLGLIPNPFSSERDLPPLVVPPRVSQAQPSTVPPATDGSADGSPIVDPVEGVDASNQAPGDASLTPPSGALPDDPGLPEQPADAASAGATQPGPDSLAGAAAAGEGPGRPAFVDSAVRDELAGMMESLPARGREELRALTERAELLYLAPELEPRVRAEAAYVASSAFAMLQDVDAMILWSRNALLQNPSHAGALELLAAVNPR